MSNTSPTKKGQLKRLFIAVAIPPQIAKELHKVQEVEEKRHETHNWRWQHQDDYHISLAFPGHQGPDGIKKVKRALSNIEFPSFEAYVQGMRCFNRSGTKNNNPHVLWASLNPSADAYLKELSKVIFAALKEEGITYGRDDVMPHITLAKVKNEHMDVLLDIIDRHDDLTSSKWTIDEVVLYNSHSKSRMGEKDAPHPYTVISRYKLKP